MCVAGNEDVDVQLPLQQRQAGHVAPRDHLVAVDEADLKLAHRHHLLLRVVQVLRVHKAKSHESSQNHSCQIIFQPFREASGQQGKEETLDSTTFNVTGF